MRSRRSRGKLLPLPGDRRPGEDQARAPDAVLVEEAQRSGERQLPLRPQAGGAGDQKAPGAGPDRQPFPEPDPPADRDAVEIRQPHLKRQRTYPRGEIQPVPHPVAIPPRHDHAAGGGEDEIKKIAWHHGEPSTGKIFRTASRSGSARRDRSGV